MHDVNVAEGFQPSSLDSNRILRIDGVASGTVANRRCDNRHISEWPQRRVQCGKAWSIKTVVVGDQKSHFEDSR